MKLPTQREIEEGWDKVEAEGPVALARLVDNVPDLKNFIQALLNDREGLKTGPFTVLKAAFAGGLHLGLQIGEVRSENAVEQWEGRQGDGDNDD